MLIESLTVEGLLSHINSGIGLDIAKNHSGVTIWDGNSVITYGFELEQYDKTDMHAEYKMRRDLKHKLLKIVDGMHFEYCVVEDVFGGDNFDTVRKLLALNTVIDELIFDGVCSVDNFYRWLESTWMKYCRLIYKQSGKLRSKFEVQGILEFLNWNFYLEHKDDSNTVKRNIYFEDICDSCGMLLGAVAKDFVKIDDAKPSRLRLSDIKMVYCEDFNEFGKIRDKRLKEEEALVVDLDFKHLEGSIVDLAMKYPDKVLCALLPSEKLGVFGMKHKFAFYDSDTSCLYFYNKKGSNG